MAIIFNIWFQIRNVIWWILVSSRNIFGFRRRQFSRIRIKCILPVSLHMRISSHYKLFRRNFSRSFFRKYTFSSKCVASPRLKIRNTAVRFAYDELPIHTYNNVIYAYRDILLILVYPDVSDKAILVPTYDTNAIVSSSPYMYNTSDRILELLKK